MGSPMDEHARTVRAVFGEPGDGFAIVERLRAEGFPVDVSGSITGDVIVRIQAQPARLIELATLVAAHRGRVETQQETDASDLA
jgi:hypothetical protein